MSEWVDATIGDLAEWRGGLTPSKSNAAFWNEGSIPWLSSKEVTGGVLQSTDHHVTEAALAGTALRLTPAGSVAVVVRSGILIHTFPVALVPFECTVNQDVKIGVPNSRTTAPFLRYLLEAHSPEILAVLRKTGTTVQSIDVPGLMAHRVKLPPIAEQRRIVDVMEAVDAQIAALDVESEQADRALTLHRANHPEGDENALNSLLLGIDSGKSVQTGGAQPRAGHARVLKLSAVRPGRFDASEAKRLDDLAGYSETHLVGEGDLLVTRANTPDRVGYVAVAHDVPERTYMPDLIWRAREDPDRIVPGYLGHLLSAPEFRRRIIATAGGTSVSMVKINKKGFGGIRVPVPPRPQQEKYVRLCDAVTRGLTSLNAELVRVRAVRATLLTSLLSQEIEIPKSYDALLAVS